MLELVNKHLRLDPDLLVNEKKVVGLCGAVQVVEFEGSVRCRLGL